MPDIIHGAKIQTYADGVKLYLPVCDDTTYTLLHDDLRCILATKIEC